MTAVRPRLLLLGGNGQLGRELRPALAPLGDLIVASRDGRLADGGDGLAADLSDAASLQQALAAAQPDVIINAAAWTAVDRAESEPGGAERVNHHAVDGIARWAAAEGAVVLHYSTDYVFDGSRGGARRETDATAPLGVYGGSKLAGEEALRASGARHLILRTAWVYAAHGHNFLLTMLRLGAERERLAVVADQVGTPTPAHQIAAASAAVLKQWLRAGTPLEDSGTFHLTAAGECSWHGFASAIFTGAVERGLLPRVPEVAAIETAEWPTPARRPARSVLDNSRLQQRFGLELPDWRVGLAEVLDQLARVREP